MSATTTSGVANAGDGMRGRRSHAIAAVPLVRREHAQMHATTCTAPRGGSAATPAEFETAFSQSVCYSHVVLHARSRPPSRVELARIVRTVRPHRPGAVSRDEGCFGSHGRRPETSVWHVCSSRLGRTGRTWTDNIGKATRETPTALPPPVVQVANAAHK